jgi:hypothetical protein
MTGSIGVIMELPDASGLLQKVGIRMQTVQSAEHKDIGSPFRPLNEGDRALLESLVRDVYDQFVAVVAKERADEAQFAGRMVAFSPGARHGAGLIDRLGNIDAGRGGRPVTGKAATVSAAAAHHRDVLFGGIPCSQCSGHARRWQDYLLYQMPEHRAAWPGHAASGRGRPDVVREHTSVGRLMTKADSSAGGRGDRPGSEGLRTGGGRLLNAIQNAMADHEHIEIRGFGTFKVRKRRPYGAQSMHR